MSAGPGTLAAGGIGWSSAGAAVGAAGGEDEAPVSAAGGVFLHQQNTRNHSELTDNMRWIAALSPRMLVVFMFLLARVSCYPYFSVAISCSQFFFT